ncbi:MAG TPA: VOC family protein [Opitutaceae bacterium]
MKVLELAFTGYPVTDMARARGFYEGLLGLTMSRKWGDEANPQWVEYDIGPGCLAIVTGAGADWPPANAGPAVALEVDDFQGFIAKLKAAKVNFIWEAQESPVCWMAVVQDPDGNRLVIHHRKAA